MGKVDLNIFEQVVLIILIVGFAFVDILFFHDIFKAGEVISVAQILTGALSILLFFVSASLLLKDWLR